jgi:hypothetical protein
MRTRVWWVYWFYERDRISMHENSFEQSHQTFLIGSDTLPLPTSSAAASNACMKNQVFYVEPATEKTYDQS